MKILLVALSVGVLSFPVAAEYNEAKKKMIEEAVERSFSNRAKIRTDEEIYKGMTAEEIKAYDYDQMFLWEYYKKYPEERAKDNAKVDTTYDGMTPEEAKAHDKKTMFWWQYEHKYPEERKKN